jgi:hypothetical protein
MIKYFKLLFIRIKKRWVKVKPLTEREQNMMDVLKKFLRAEHKDIHCDANNQKYSVKYGDTTIAINGTDETVYVLVENAECGSNPIKVDLEKGFVIILINLIVTEKSRLSNLIYDKMSNSVNVFLKDLNKTT